MDSRPRRQAPGLRPTCTTGTMKGATADRERELALLAQVRDARERALQLEVDAAKREVEAAKREAAQQVEATKRSSAASSCSAARGGRQA